MLHTTLAAIVDYFQGKGLIDQENAPWCVYVLERQSMTALSFFAAFLLGCLFTAPQNIFALLLSVSQIRKWSGGYHCKTVRRCYCLSMGMILIGLLVAHFLIAHLFLQGCLLLLSSAFLISAPVDQPELHLSPIEIEGNRKRLRLVQVVIVVVWIAFSSFHCPISAYCTVGYIIAAISVFAANFTHERRKHYHGFSEQSS